MKAYARLLYRRVTHEDLGRYFKLLIPILLTCFVSLKGLIFYWTPEVTSSSNPTFYLHTYPNGLVNCQDPMNG